LCEIPSDFDITSEAQRRESLIAAEQPTIETLLVPASTQKVSSPHASKGRIKQFKRNTKLSVTSCVVIAAFSPWDVARWRHIGQAKVCCLHAHFGQAKVGERSNARSERHTGKLGRMSSNDVDSPLRVLELLLCRRGPHTRTRRGRRVLVFSSRLFFSGLRQQDWYRGL
jgi:hypothetical protein